MKYPFAEDRGNFPAARCVPDFPVGRGSDKEFPADKKSDRTGSQTPDVGPAQRAAVQGRGPSKRTFPGERSLASVWKYDAARKGQTHHPVADANRYVEWVFPAHGRQKRHAGYQLCVPSHAS